VIIFIVPKNSGLERCKKIAKDFSKENTKIIEVRGEDIPEFVEKMILQKKDAIGITGEDMFKEFTLKIKNPGIKILKKINWKDETAIFGKPTLCLLGPDNKELYELSKNLKVCINKKYSMISKKFLSRLEEQGFRFEKIYYSGSTESAFTEGISDLVVDIVYSGKASREAGLKIYEKILESDIVVIGKKTIEKEKSDLQKLYDIVYDRIQGDNKQSYTKGLVNDPEVLKRKLIEEAAEVITAKNKEELIWECSDLLYFLTVFMAMKGITLEEIYEETERRNSKSKETFLNSDELNITKEEK